MVCATARGGSLSQRGPLGVGYAATLHGVMRKRHAGKNAGLLHDFAERSAERETISENVLQIR